MMNACRQGNAYDGKNKTVKPEKAVILYQRLSREDGDKAESDSIQNQRRILTEYAERNDLMPYISIQDDGFDQDSLNVDRFMELVHHYTVFDELTTPMLYEFVDRVIVHEADRSTGERVQQVDIHLNFVGHFIIPGTEPALLTPEEQATEELRLAQKRIKNEKLRNWRAKKRAEKLAQNQQTTTANT